MFSKGKQATVKFANGNKTRFKPIELLTSASKLRPSSLQMCNMRLLTISPESGLNLNLAHLEARGSMIL